MKKILRFYLIIITIFILSFVSGLFISSFFKSDEEESEEVGFEDNMKANHFLIKDIDGYVQVFVFGIEDEELYMTTEIPTQYLPNEDKKNLKKGIEVYDKNEMYRILQDFE